MILSIEPLKVGTVKKHCQQVSNLTKSPLRRKVGGALICSPMVCQGKSRSSLWLSGSGVATTAVLASGALPTGSLPLSLRGLPLPCLTGVGSGSRVELQWPRF
jgi:hypothetical protein